MSTALPPMYEWKDLPWKKVERQVFKLQQRIYQASKRGDRKTVHRLQRLLTRSRSAKLLAVRRVTQFGPTREAVAALQPVLNSQEGIAAEPFPFGPVGGENGPPNEFTWHRLVAASKKTPSDPSLPEFAFDPAALTDGWVPVIVLPLNLPEFPPALRLRGDTIEIALHTALKADPSGWKLA